MPLYEYQCDACAHRFEVIRKFSDPPLETCPSCGGPVRKLVSSPAFQFKGTGWYITDYARKSDGGKGAGEGKGSPPKDAASSGGSASSASSDAGSSGSTDKAPASTPSSTKSS